MHDAIVVGSGPSGYTAAIYLARAALVPLVFEGSVTAGGALMNTTDVENYPGFPDGVMGPQLMDDLRKQAERFGAQLVTDDVTEMDLTSDPKAVTVGDTTYYAKTVLLAMGSAYRNLDIPGETALSGRGVSWCATCDGFFFRDQDVVVVGGGDTAVEEATFLTRFARSVTMVHRRDTLRASKVMQQRAFSNDKIRFEWDTEVLEAVGTDKLEAVRLRNRVTGEEKLLPATGLFIAVGHDPRSELVKGQVELDDDGHVLVEPSTTATNVAGVFAAGDLVDHRYRQAITAAGTGCAAALDAERHLTMLEDTPPDPTVGFDTGVPAAPPDRPGVDGGTGRAPQYAQRPY
ncbi:MAG: thioredoxin-disulfide reductase [Rhodoferax sp.]|nr:thioredoxin-disulfide reductase [Actinomycetota bacterium]